MKKWILVVVICFIALAGLNMTAYTVAEDEVAVVKTMGKIVKVIIDNLMVQKNWRHHVVSNDQSSLGSLG